jgi:hypothetical protein
VKVPMGNLVLLSCWIVGGVLIVRPQAAGSIADKPASSAETARIDYAYSLNSDDPQLYADSSDPSGIQFDATGDDDTTLEINLAPAKDVDCDAALAALNEHEETTGFLQDLYDRGFATVTCRATYIADGTEYSYTATKKLGRITPAVPRAPAKPRYRDGSERERLPEHRPKDYAETQVEHLWSSLGQQS